VETYSVDPRSTVFLATASESRDYLPLLRWLVLMSLTGFGLAALWQLDVIQVMLETDRTHISSLILGLFALTSLHCLAQIWYISRELVAARSFRSVLREDRQHPDIALGDQQRAQKGSTMARHVANLVAKARSQGGGRVDQTLLLRVLANKLHGRERLGLFVSEALLRLALLGTALGFILMLIPIAGLSAFDPETLRKALSGMSGGMAIALNITVTGIGTALVLKLEYFFLGVAVIDLVNTITEVTEVHVISVLERDRNGSS
jgi:hypothetical protein